MEPCCDSVSEPWQRRSGWSPACSQSHYLPAWQFRPTLSSALEALALDRWLEPPHLPTPTPPPTSPPGTLADTQGYDYKHHLFSRLTYPGSYSSLAKDKIEMGASVNSLELHILARWVKFWGTHLLGIKALFQCICQGVCCKAVIRFFFFSDLIIRHMVRRDSDKM